MLFNLTIYLSAKNFLNFRFGLQMMKNILYSTCVDLRWLAFKFTYPKKTWAWKLFSQKLLRLVRWLKLQVPTSKHKNHKQKKSFYEGVRFGADRQGSMVTLFIKNMSMKRHQRQTKRLFLIRILNFFCFCLSSPSTLFFLLLKLPKSFSPKHLEPQLPVESRRVVTERKVRSRKIKFKYFHNKWFNESFSQCWVSDKKRQFSLFFRLFGEDSIEGAKKTFFFSFFLSIFFSIIFGNFDTLSCEFLCVDGRKRKKVWIKFESSHKNWKFSI